MFFLPIPEPGRALTFGRATLTASPLRPTGLSRGGTRIGTLTPGQHPVVRTGGMSAVGPGTGAGTPITCCLHARKERGPTGRHGLPSLTGAHLSRIREIQFPHPRPLSPASGAGAAQPGPGTLAGGGGAGAGQRCPTGVLVPSSQAALIRRPLDASSSPRVGATGHRASSVFGVPNTRVCTRSHT